MYWQIGNWARLSYLCWDFHRHSFTWKAVIASHPHDDLFWASDLVGQDALLCHTAWQNHTASLDQTVCARVFPFMKRAIYYQSSKKGWHSCSATLFLCGTAHLYVPTYPLPCLYVIHFQNLATQNFLVNNAILSLQRCLAITLLTSLVQPRQVLFFLSSKTHQLFSG